VPRARSSSSQKDKDRGKVKGSIDPFQEEPFPKQSTPSISDGGDLEDEFTKLFSDVEPFPEEDDKRSIPRRKSSIITGTTEDFDSLFEGDPVQGTSINHFDKLLHAKSGGPSQPDPFATPSFSQTQAPNPFDMDPFGTPASSTPHVASAFVPYSYSAPTQSKPQFAMTSHPQQPVTRTSAQPIPSQSQQFDPFGDL